MTATYADRGGSGKSAAATTAEVVVAARLTGLTVSTGDSSSNAARRLKPAFNANVLHYAVGCSPQGDTMTVAPSASSGVRLAVDGIQTTSGRAVSVSVNQGAGDESDVRITLADAAGASTTYVVHCLSVAVGSRYSLWSTEVRRKPGATGIMEEFIATRRDTSIAILDTNGVPRFHRRVNTGSASYFRPHRLGAGGEFRYSYWSGRGWTILNQDFEPIGTATTESPLTSTDFHDALVLDNGNYLVMAYQWTREVDLSYLTFGAYSSSAALADSAIQIVTPARNALFTWRALDHFALEDCTQGTFPSGYSHLNSLQMVGGHIIASFRGCSTVLRIDPQQTGSSRIVWRIGRSNLTDGEWESRGLGPPPLAIVNDPEGEFCAQHGARILPNGNLLLYDNGALCVENPVTGEELARRSGVFSRAVEYALDLTNREAVFLRDHSFRGARNHVAPTQGHVDPLSNGDWLISWGSGGGRTDEAVTQVDPKTGVEKFVMLFPARLGRYAVRALPLAPEALASAVEPLVAATPDSVPRAGFHTGSSSRPQVVVSFNPPVKDFESGTPSVRVTGGAVETVVPRMQAGEPAHSYLFTLAPTGNDGITFELTTDAACADGGICAADGTTLSEGPGALFVPGPVVVSFGTAAVAVNEGQSGTVTVSMQPAHGRVGELIGIPIVVQSESTAASRPTTGGRPPA